MQLHNALHFIVPKNMQEESYVVSATCYVMWSKLI